MGYSEWVPCVTPKGPFAVNSFNFNFYFFPNENSDIYFEIVLKQVRRFLAHYFGSSLSTCRKAALSEFSIGAVGSLLHE